MSTILGIITAALSLVLVLVRVVESIYELRKNPDLDTFGECVQVIRNFFTIETYKGGTDAGK